MISTLDKVALESAGSLALKTGFDLGWAPGTATYLVGKGIEGWTGSSPIRRNKAELLGAHGTHAERGYKDERLITITGHHVAANRAAAGQYADNLAAFLGDGTKGILRVDDASLGSRWAEVYLAAGGVDVTWTGGVDVRFQINMVAPDPRKYGTPTVSAATGIPVPGTGLMYPLFSRGVLSSAVTRTNLATNPSAAVTTRYTYWAGTGGVCTLTNVATGGYVGDRFNRITWTTGTTAITGGGIYAEPAPVALTTMAHTAVMWVRPSVAQNMQLIVQLYAGATPTGSAWGVATPCPADTWTRLEASFIPAAGDNRLEVRGYVSATGVLWPTGSTLDMDAVLVERTANLAAVYFDGDYSRVEVDADTARTYSWSGTPNASTSLETTTEYAGPPGVLDIGSGGYPGRASVTNAGKADTGTVFTIWGDYVPGFTLTHLATGRRLVYTETLTAGQSLVLDANDGSVTLDGYAPRDSKLVVSDWIRLGPGETGTWQFDSPGSVNAQFTVGVTPAWW